MIPPGFEAFAFDATLGGFVLFEEVECDTVKDGEILRGVALPFATEVFAEGDVEHPMQFVFDAPVLADDAVQLRGIKLEAGDVVTRFAFAFACGLVITLGLDPHQPLQRRPFHSLLHQAQVPNDRAGTPLHASMAAIDLLRYRIDGKHSKRILDLFQQVALILFDRQNIIRLLADDLLCDAPLAADGVDGHYRSAQLTTAAIAINKISSSKCSRFRSTRGSRTSAKYFRGFSISPSHPFPPVCI